MRVFQKRKRIQNTLKEMNSTVRKHSECSREKKGGPKHYQGDNFHCENVSEEKGGPKHSQQEREGVKCREGWQPAVQKGTKGQKRCVVKVRKVVLKMGERILVQEILFCW